MHAVFVTPAYPPLPGGGERYVAALARGLAESGVRITVITSMANAEADFWNGVTATSDTMEGLVRVVRLPLAPMPGGRRGLLLWRKVMVLLSALPDDQSRWLARMARRVPALEGLEETLGGLGEVDLVHGFNISWESGIVAAHVYGDARQIPRVITPFLHLGVSATDRVARNSTMDHQLRLMHEVSQLQVLTRIEAVGLERLRIPSGNIKVIGGGFDEPPTGIESSPYFAEDHPEAQGEFGLYIGRLSFDKGALHAADAVRQLRSRGRNLALLLIGSDTPEFERYRRRLSPEDRAAIRPLGVLSDRDKHAVLSRARFLMLPSRSDSFGIVILEAWSHRVPVIAARAGGIPGVIDDGVNGLLVSFADVNGLALAAERVLGDQMFTERLTAQAAEKLANQFQWENVVERVMAGYETLTAGG